MKTSKNNRCATLGKAIQNPKYFCRYLGNGVAVCRAGTIYGNHHLLMEKHFPPRVLLWEAWCSMVLIHVSTTLSTLISRAALTIDDMTLSLSWYRFWFLGFRNSSSMSISIFILSTTFRNVMTKHLNL